MASYKKTITLALDYNQFKGGISECNSQMKMLDAEFKLSQSQMELTGSSADKVALKHEYMGNKIALQSQKVEEAKKKYNALMDAQADTKKIEKADAALLKERTTLQDLQNEYEKTRLADSRLKENLQLTAGVLATIGVGIGKCAMDAAEYADNILTLSNNTGIATDTLQKYEYAADLVDVSTETMTSSVAKLVKNMGTASEGTGDAADAFKLLGIKITDSSGHMKDSEDVFMDTIDALGKIENQTERDQLAMTLFGKSAQDLGGLIKVGSEGLKEYGDEAEKLGLIMNSEELQSAGNFSDAMGKLESSFDGLKNTLGLMVLPALTKLIDAIAGVPQPVLATITIILTIIVTLVTLYKTINSVVKAGDSIRLMFKGLNGGLNVTTLKIMAVVISLVALAAAISVIIGKGNQLNGILQGIGNMTGAATGNISTGHNANGTQNWRGGATWVGENGPEILNVPRGSQIISNNESKMLTNANNTYYVTIDAKNVSDFNKVVDICNNLNTSMRKR